MLLIKLKNPWNSFLLPLVVLLAFAHTLWRIHYGVDFSDESWYIVLGYRFFQGDRPLIDETNVVQSMGFLIAPVIGIYLKLKGSLDGIILFTRSV